MDIKFNETTKGIDWLNHFKGVDRLTAEKLLEGITWISAFEFTKGLRTSIEEQANKLNGPVGLFVERELRKNQHGVQHFYKEKKKPKTAYGVALQPIESKNGTHYEVGSEGVIASFLTELTRGQGDKYYYQPTIESIKKEKIEAFFIVTDTIGSGDQISTFLDSMWKVATIKSLHSFKRLKFYIISYATTLNGLKTIQSHKVKPTVIYSIQCPTIDSEFNKDEAKEIKDFCERYYLKKNNNYGPLGYQNCGTLIAYAHGIPNNAPIILHKKSKKNIPPLFISRVIGKIKEELNTGILEVDHTKVLERNQQLKLSTSNWLKTANKEAKDFIVVLAALNKKPRSTDAISKRTSIKIIDVEKLITLAKKCEWVAESGRLTDEGINLLEHLKVQKKKRKDLVWEIDMGYYPKSLRMP